MKVNNIVLFALLIMLSNVSFAKKLNQGEPKFESIGANQIISGQVYYISTIDGKYLTTHSHEDNLFELNPFKRRDSKNQGWVFEKYKNGSFSIRNAFNYYLTTSGDGKYKLLKWDKENPAIHNFIYENRSIKSTKTNLCLQINPKKSQPYEAACPQTVDIKKLLN